MWAERGEICWDKAGVAPRERREAEVEDAVEFIERDAHVETDFGGGEASAAGGLHDGEGVEVEPADRRVEG